jgi:hypothetical protein
MDYNEIQLRLEALPVKIETQEYEVIKLKDLLDKSELALSIDQAKVMLTSGRPNATEKKMEAITQTTELAFDIISLKTQVRDAEAKMTMLINGFAALRKIISLEVEIIKSKLM